MTRLIFTVAALALGSSVAFAGGPSTPNAPGGVIAIVPPPPLPPEPTVIFVSPVPLGGPASNLTSPLLSNFLSIYQD